MRLSAAICAAFLLSALSFSLLNPVGLLGPVSAQAQSQLVHQIADLENSIKSNMEDGHDIFGCEGCHQRF